mgnify:CR=1 FL=1
MKIFKYFFICLSIFAVVSCEDDSEVFDEGNPLNRNIINLEGTVSTQTTIAGEGDKISFEATIPQTFESAVTVTALFWGPVRHPPPSAKITKNTQSNSKT